MAVAYRMLRSIYVKEDHLQFANLTSLQRLQLDHGRQALFSHMKNQSSRTDVEALRQ